MRVLGIETSCDETGVAIYDGEQGLLAHKLYSQIELHAQYGGVVPELASRDHIRKLVPLLKATMQEASSTADDIDLVAYTAGPGLIGALLVGATFARSLAWGWQKPSLAIHHLEAHLLAPFLEQNPPQFPYLALLVSGGHSQIMLVKAVGNYELLGETLDDAAGEAFDKTAKMLGLGYPGGAVLAKLAEKGEVDKYKFPRPMTDRPGLAMSFSGLKTHTLTTWNQSDKTEQEKCDIAAAFQAAVIDTLCIKCERALRQTGASRLVLAGGVAANSLLRERFADLAQQLNAQIFYPRPEYCTDNGAMVAITGFMRSQTACAFDSSLAVLVKPRWPF